MSNTHATIKLAANHNKLILVKSQPLVSGNINSVFVEFDLRTDDWVSCNKLRVVFNDYYVQKLEGTLKCSIPQEVLATPGEFSINLYGIAGNMRLATNKIDFYVGEGGYGGIFEDDDDEPEIDDSKLVIYDGGGVNGY